MKDVLHMMQLMKTNRGRAVWCGPRHNESLLPTVLLYPIAAYLNIGTWVTILISNFLLCCFSRNSIVHFFSSLHTTVVMLDKSVWLVHMLDAILISAKPLFPIPRVRGSQSRGHGVFSGGSLSNLKIRSWN